MSSRSTSAPRVARPEGGFPMAAEVFVAGVGMLKFGRYSETDVPELGGEAALLALDDAGLDIHDVQIMAADCLFQPNAMIGQRILQELGQPGSPVRNEANAGASGTTACRTAWQAGAAEECRGARAGGVAQIGKSELADGGSGSGIRTEGGIDSRHMPAVFGQAGMEHMRKY